MGPIDYSIDVQTPFQAVLQGYQGGVAIREDQLAQQQRAAAAQARQQMHQEIAAVSANPNAGARDYAALTMKYPALKDQFKQSWDMVGKDQQAGRLDLMTRAYSALSSGRPDIAEKVMRDRAEAMRNSGAPEREVQAQEMWANLIKESPEQARHIGGLMLSSVMEPDKFGSTFSTLSEQGRAADKAPADVAKAEAEAQIKGIEAGVAQEKSDVEIADKKDQIAERARRFNLDSDKLRSDVEMELYRMQQKNGELPEAVSKEITAATTDALASDQSATRMIQLADQIDKASSSLGSGVSAKAGELWKNTFGSQNELTRIRAEYSRIVTPAAMRAYKANASGSTSDRDIDTAMKGVPPDTADPAEMASFLRGVAKLQVYDSALNNAKSEWFGAVKNLGKAKTDIEIDGVRVPAGTTFKNFADQYVERKVGQVQADQAVKKVHGRGYMRFAQPQGGAPTAPAAGPGVSAVLPATGGM